jgi:hypothetical protein
MRLTGSGRQRVIPLRCDYPCQVQQMLGLHSRWQAESFLHRTGAFHDYTMDDIEMDIAAIRGTSVR